MAKTFKCPVCQEEYTDSIEALNCAQKFGYYINKYQIGQRVICCFKNLNIEGTISSIIWSKPSMAHRKPHTIIYSVKIEKINGDIPQVTGNTTATEEEIKLILNV